MGGREQVAVDGRTLSVSNLDRVLYPATGTTKADVLRYYLGVAPTILPHLAGRPVTLRRYPDGVAGEGFFQKRCPDHRPDWVPTIEVPRSRRAGEHETIAYCELTEPAALVWAANLAALELHVPMGRRPRVDAPTAVVFDLDPGPGTGLLECAWLALRIRGVLVELGLEAVVKTSGGAGLQVYVPVDPERTTADTARGFAETITARFVEKEPARVVMTQRRTERRGKVLIDWTQNHPVKTTVCAYSLRARERPTISAPLRWEEVERAESDGDERGLVVELDDALPRLERHGDLFAAALEPRQVLPELA